MAKSLAKPAPAKANQAVSQGKSAVSSGKARIAVLMASCNDKPAILKAAIASVINSVTPVDVFLVDDGSKIPVTDILRPTPNLHVLRLNKNGGLPAALNHGLKEILKNPQYTYIARFDSDDISMPERFTRQLAFLDANPDVDLVGTWAQFIDESDNHLFYFNPPTTHAGIVRGLRANNCILHPSWLMRAEFMKKSGGYSTNFPVAQDYEFLTRTLHQGATFAQIPEYLLRYRVSSGGISVSKRRRQLAARLRIQWRHYTPFNIYATLGIVKTLVLFAVPMGLIQQLKVRLKAYRARR